MLTTLIKENIQIIDEELDWKSAVRKSVEPLIRSGLVYEDYTDEIIRSTLTYGPYYVIAPDIALVHGSADKKIDKCKSAVTVLRHKVYFSPESEPVRLIISFASPDSDTHMDMLRNLVNLIENEKRVKDIIEAENENEIYDIIIKNNQEVS